MSDWYEWLPVAGATGIWIIIATIYHLAAQRRRKRAFERTMRKRYKERPL